MILWCFSLFEILFIFNFLAVLGLRCFFFFARAFSNCGAWGLLFVGLWPRTEAASLVAVHRLRHVGFSSCSTRAQWLWLVGPRTRRLHYLWYVGSVVWPVGSRVWAQQLWCTDLAFCGM